MDISIANSLMKQERKVPEYNQNTNCYSTQVLIYNTIKDERTLYNFNICSDCEYVRKEVRNVTRIMSYNIWILMTKIKTCDYFLSSFMANPWCKMIIVAVK